MPGGYSHDVYLMVHTVSWYCLLQVIILYHIICYPGPDDDEKGKTALIPEPSIHEQEDGIILAMCITGTSNKDSLVSWVALLQVCTPFTFSNL